MSTATTAPPRRFTIDCQDRYTDCARDYVFQPEIARQLVALHLGAELDDGELGHVEPERDTGCVWFFAARADDFDRREQHLRNTIRDEHAAQVEALPARLEDEFTRRASSRALTAPAALLPADVKAQQATLKVELAARLDAEVAERLAKPAQWEHAFGGTWRDAASGAQFTVAREYLLVTVATGEVDPVAVPRYCVLVTDVKLREDAVAELRARDVTPVLLGEGFREFALKRGVLRPESPIADLPTV